MKRFAAVLVCVGVAASALFLGGCKKSDTASAGALIGIAVPETHVQRWVKDGERLKAEAEKRGYRAELQFGDADQSIQNRQIQTLIGLDAKLIVVGNISDEVAPVIAEAAQKKVSVIAYDRLIQNSADYDYYITFNNYKVGVLQGQSLADALGLEQADPKTPKSITLFAGSLTDGNAFFFYDGAMSVLNPYIEKGVLKVVGPYPKTSADKENFAKIATEGWQGPIAKARMVALLKEDAKSVTLDAVLAPNDHIARAIIDACRPDPKYKGKQLPLVTGQDAEFESAMLINAGEQLSTVFKNTSKLAEAAIILADQIIKGETPDIPGAVLAEGPLAEMGNTGKKVVKAYLLDPVLVTKDNLSVPIDAEFYTAAETEALK
jgi:putative multiple sugar transport system substrate-binding protein